MERVFNSTMLLLVCGHMLGFAPLFGAENLVPNPSFEEGGDNQPKGWRYDSGPDSNGSWDSQFAHTGRRSLKLQGINGGWKAEIPVQAGKIHNISFHYRAECGAGRLTLTVRNPGAPRERQVVLYKPQPAIDANQRGRFVDGDYVDGADEKGWVIFEGGGFLPDEGIASVSVMIAQRGDNPKAQVWLDDVVVSVVEPRVVPDTAVLLRRADDGVVWTDSENRKILPVQPPPAGEARDAIHISAAQGEYESFQIAVTPNRRWSGVQWSWADFSGAALLPGSILRCRRVELINIARTEGPYGLKGLNPDPLTDRLPCDIPAGTNQAFWFTVHVPDGQAPGNYENQLVLSADGKPVCRIPVKLRVRNFAIPKRPSLEVMSNFRWPLVLERESGDAGEILRRYYRDYFEHRTRCPAGASVRVQLKGETATVDAAEYLNHLKFQRDELGARRFNIPLLWISHKETHKMPPDAQWERHRIFANPELTQLNAEFEKPFRSYMTQFVKMLKDEGLFLSPSARFFDEPNFEDKATVNALKTLASLMLDIEPQMTISMTATYPHPELTDVIREWCIHTDAWHREYQHIENARKAGCRIYVYNNAVNYPEHKPLRVRLWPWLLRKYEADGTYSWWGTVCWRDEMADPWNSGRGSSGVLFYPPRAPDERGPIDSIRWELFREGLEDYEYMRLADRLIAQLEAAGRGEAAKKGCEALNEALDLVQKWPNVRAANDEPYTLDVKAVAGARENLAAAIELMQEALK